MATDPTEYSSDILHRGGTAPVPVAVPPATERWISLLEARRIALEILAEAENERLRYAESDASRGLDSEQYS
jgi:glutamate dehydrogenase/leucine dehydrogenase